jgi:hypothetical protein
VLKCGLQFVPHAFGDVTVDAAHARNFMAHAFRFQDLRDAVLVHPRLVTVPKAVCCEARQYGQPRRKRHIGSGLLA